MSLTKRVLLALVLGIMLGVLVAQSESAALIRAVQFIEPIGSMWINAIRMTVIPLVAASLIGALAAAPDARLAGRIGVLAVAVFLALLTATAILVVLVVPPLLSGLTIDPTAAASLREGASASGTAAAQTRLPGFAQWLAELIPVNPIRAAADGALLPLIVFSVALGAAVTRISSESRMVFVRFFSAVSDAMLRLMHWILQLAPLGVFALALPLASRLGISAAGAIAYFILLVSGLCVLLGLLLYPAVALFGRIPMRTFARAVAQAQVVAATSRSSLAALPAVIQGAEQKLSLNPALTRFFLPLAASTFRIGAVVAQIAGVLFLARLYGVDVTTATLLTIAVTSILTSFSVPGIAGGSIIVMLPVLASAGIPPEGIGILIGVDAIPDIFRTAVNVTGHMAGAALIAPHVKIPSSAPQHVEAD